MPLLVFCSLVLVAGAIVLFVWSAKQGDCHEAERLCLLPLADDTAPPAGAATDPSSTSPLVPRKQAP
ncbi:MAG: cbb3-type cytochrome oxidase assembly protein CcoS [Planctomycetota bacterium]